MQNSKLRKFIIITVIVLLEHDSVIRRENALGDPLARRFTHPRRVRRCRAHRRCSRSSIPDALCDYPEKAPQLFGSASADLMMSRAPHPRMLINRTDTRMQPIPAARYLRTRRCSRAFARM